MKNSSLLGAVAVFVITFISATAQAITVGPELVADPNFDDPGSWNVGIGNSKVENGQLIAINHSGFIFPEPVISVDIGVTYQYELTVDLVNNLAGNGKVTVGGQTIWEPSDNTGTFIGTILASDTAGLVFNFITTYAGRAEFDSVSVKAVLATPIPAAAWLFGSGLLGLIGMARHKKS